MDSVKIQEGWVMADDCKIAKWQSGLVLQFHDKDRRRSSMRGTDQIEVSLVELLEVCCLAEGLDILWNL